MRVRSSLKKMCEQCKTVRRGRKVFVVCKGNAKHKQRQGYHTDATMQNEIPLLSNNSNVPPFTSSVPSLLSIRRPASTFSEMLALPTFVVLADTEDQ